MKQTQNNEEIAEIKTKISSLLMRKLVLTKARLVSFQNNLKKCMQWQLVQHEAMLLQSNYLLIKKGMLSIVVEDWNDNNSNRSISMDPALSPAQNIAAKYKLSKRLRRGLDAAKAALQKQEESLYTLRCQIEEITKLESATDLKTILTGLEPKSVHPLKQSTLRPVKLAYKVYKSDAGVLIWVGKGAKQNDELTFMRSRGSDWWCHVEGGGGAHVLIKSGKDEVDPETLQDAFQLALAFSTLRDSKYASVILTQVKYIKPMGKSSPGKVQVAKGKSYAIERDLERLQIIKKRNK